MKKTLVGLCALLCALTMSSCHYANVNSDSEGVLTEQPAFFGHGGIDVSPVESGSEIVAASTKIDYVKIVPVTYGEDLENILSLDHTAIDVQAYLQLKVEKGNGPKLLKGFGIDWYTNNIKQVFRTQIRDRAVEHNMFDLAANRVVLTDISNEIQKNIEAYVTKIGMPVTIIGVSIGSATPPEEVLKETRVTAAQNQSILTQAARAKAETARKAAESAKAEADMAYKNLLGMSNQEYLVYRSIEVQREKIELVRDKPNVTIVLGDHDVMPSFPIKK